jgi:tetratricopeptide (TPR) repeat protein
VWQDFCGLAALPGSIALQLLRFDALFESGDIEGASALMSRLAQVQADNASTLFRRAKLAQSKGDFSGAEQLLRSAVAIAEDAPPPSSEALTYRLALGKFLFSVGRFQDAEAEYSKASKSAPDWWMVKDHIAELRGAQRRYDEAVRLFQDVYQATQRPEVAQSVGDILTLQGNTKAAAEWFDRAQKGYENSLASGHKYYLHHLSSFFCDSKLDLEKALRYAKEDLELRHSADAFDLLAWAHYKNGQIKEALEQSEKALVDGSHNAHIVYHAAMIRGANGDFAGSKELLARAATLNPSFTEFHVHR